MLLSDVLDLVYSYFHSPHHKVQFFTRTANTIFFQYYGFFFFIYLSQRPFHKTLPKSNAFMNRISVRFYETDCMTLLNMNTLGIQRTNIFGDVTIMISSLSTWDRTTPASNHITTSRSRIQRKSVIPPSRGTWRRSGSPTQPLSS